MKILLLVISIMALMCVNAMAVTFQWDVNADDPEGYVLYFNEVGDTDTPYNTAPIAHPTNTVVVDDLKFVPGTTYDVWVTAYNTRGESGPSNMIQHLIDPFIPPVENLPVNLPAPSIPANMTSL